MGAKRVYGIYALADKGTAEELAIKYFVEPKTVRRRAEEGGFLLGEYMVVPLPEQKLKEYSLFEKGRSDPVMRGTAFELAEYLGTTRGTIYEFASAGLAYKHKYTILGEG